MLSKLKLSFLITLAACNYQAPEPTVPTITGTGTSTSTVTVEAITPTPSPIVHANFPPHEGDINITCKSGCSAEQKANLPKLIELVRRTRGSQCFSNFFTKQAKIDENKGKTAEQIIADLRTKDFNNTLTIYYPSIFHRLVSKECGYDNADGSIWMKAQCYQAYSDCQKAGFIMHEIAHAFSYTHYTGGNQAALNEHTVPYLSSDAFGVCCK